VEQHLAGEVLPQAGGEAAMGHAGLGQGVHSSLLA